MQTHNGWSSNIKPIEAVQSRSARLVENGWERTHSMNELNNQVWRPLQSIAGLLKPEWNSFENPFFPCTREMCLGPIPIPDNNSFLRALPTPLPFPLTSWSGLFKEALMILFIVMRISFCFLNRLWIGFSLLVYFFLSFFPFCPPLDFSILPSLLFFLHFIYFYLFLIFINFFLFFIIYINSFCCWFFFYSASLYFLFFVFHDLLDRIAECRFTWSYKRIWRYSIV